MMNIVNTLGFIALSTSLFRIAMPSRSREIAKPACFLYFYSKLEESEPSDEQIASINKQVEDGWRNPLERVFMVEKARSYSHWRPEDIYRIAKMSGYQDEYILI